MSTIKAVVFDWGDTIMRDFPEFKGPMAFWPRVELVPGAREALEQLHQRFVCCVASNAGDSDAELMGRALERSGIRQYFQALYTSRELGFTKPEPVFFQEILNRLGVEPSACVMVGNDYDKDIIPAKAVGMRTIWFSPSDPVSESMPGADAVIHEMRDLAAAVDSLRAL